MTTRIDMSRVRRLLRALGTIMASFVRVLYAPGRARDFFAYIYLYRPLAYSSRITCTTLPNILDGVGAVTVNLRKCFPEHGNMTAEEIITICLLVRWARPRGIFEFGTFNGNTTLQMALNMEDDCMLYTLNLPPDHYWTHMVSSAQDRRVYPRITGSGLAFRDEPERARINELFGDSALFDFTPYIERCDFVFVDAGHEYDSVKSDTENALRLLPSNGGVIVWHDFPNAPGVCTWLEECSSRFHIYHVIDTRLAFTVVGRPARCGEILLP
jgi:hypothetical protein